MFEKIEQDWLSWGLYIDSCLEHNIELGSHGLPYDYISGYEYANLNQDLRLYGGEIGLFKFLDCNVELLHETYVSMEDDNPLKIAITEHSENGALLKDIVNGIGTSGVDWSIGEDEQGIFNHNELEMIKQLLTSPEGLEQQFYFLEQRLYNYYDNWAITFIENFPTDDKGRCLLATYLLYNNESLWWIDLEIPDTEEVEPIYSLEEVADNLLKFTDYERIKVIYDYIKELDI